METDETRCKIIMPLFDFQNKDGVQYSFLDGQYKLQRFASNDELVNEKLFSEQDREYISLENWAIVVDSSKDLNYKEEINILLLAFRITKKCRAFIKYRLSPNCKKKISKLSETVQFTLKDDTTRMIEGGDFERINEVFKKLLEMKNTNLRTYNAILFLFKAYNSKNWLDAFIYHMMCLESLFSKEHKSNSERTICLRVSTFLYDKYGTKYSDVQPLYELRSKLVHGSFALNTETPPEENLATLRKLEDLILNVFRTVLDDNIYILYVNADNKEAYLNELSRTKAHLVRIKEKSMNENNEANFDGSRKETDLHS